MTEVIASVDLGSHSLHLQLAELQAGRVVFGEVHREGTSLAARGGLSGQPLHPDAVRSALEALTRFRDLADRAGARHRVCWATAALREADDPTFLELAEQRLGCPVRVLSGHEEALVTWLGSRLRVPPHPRPLVVDLGAGSTELAYGRDDPELLASFAVGHARAAATWPRGALATPERLIDLAAAELAPVAAAAGRHPWERLVATGGTARTLARMAGLDRVDGASLANPTLTSLLARLATTPADRLHTLPGVDLRRRHSLLHGAALWCGMLRALDVDRMTVVRPTLREGLLELWLRERAGRVGDPG